MVDIKERLVMRPESTEYFLSIFIHSIIFFVSISIENIPLQFIHFPIFRILIFAVSQHFTSDIEDTSIHYSSCCYYQPLNYVSYPLCNF